MKILDEYNALLGRLLLLTAVQQTARWEASRAVLEYLPRYLRP